MAKRAQNAKTPTAKPASKRRVKQKGDSATPAKTVALATNKAKQRDEDYFNVELLPQIAFTTPKNKTKITSGDKRYLRAAAEIMLVQGYSTWEVAGALKVPQSTVSFWLSKIDQETKDKIEENIRKAVAESMSSFLNSSLRAMGKVAQYCSSDEYLDKHPPDKVATLFDVIGNRSFQLIEAQQRAQMAKNQALSGYAPKGYSENGQESEETNSLAVSPIDVSQSSKAVDQQEGEKDNAGESGSTKAD